MIVQKSVLVAATTRGQRGAIEGAIRFGNGTNMGVPTREKIFVFPHFCDSIVATICSIAQPIAFDAVVVEADIEFERGGIQLLNELRNRGHGFPRILITGDDDKAFEHVDGWTLEKPRFFSIRSRDDVQARLIEAMRKIFIPEPKVPQSIAPKRRYESIAP